MNKSDFDFYLPERLIAQTPLEKRDSSRLLHLDKKTGAIEHGHFHDITKYLKKGDCLVMNDSRVLPARLIGSRLSGGLVELVLLRDLGDGCWECLSRPGRKTKPGTELTFGDGELTATVMDVAVGGNRIVKFHFEGIFIEKLEKLGKMPLPPYIKRDKPAQGGIWDKYNDKENYQTIYARFEGAVAAPTAGLHFTDRVFRALEEKGVEKVFVTLHVGAGTFLPVKTADTKDHKMHTEYCEISPEACDAVNRAKAEGRRIIAVGTTSLRLLETAADEQGVLHPFAGDTGIFITPGYKFRAIDMLITNFHLPKSTLFMLICAVAGTERMKAAYRHAIEQRYRFYSYGDSSILKCVNKI